MKAIIQNRTGGPSALEPAEINPPALKAGQALVKVHYAGVNFIDVYFRNGVYPVKSFPFVPGKEGSGEIVEIGEGLTGFSIGDRVGFPFGGTGTYADYVALNESEMVRLPDGMNYDTAAACMLQGLTAHYLCNSTFEVREGQIVLIHAGAGGVGRLLIQMCKAKGARVFATVSTEHKKEKALSAGADGVVLYENYRFASEFLGMTDGEKAHAVFDSVAKATFEESLQCIRPRGLLALFGNSSGVVPPFQLNRLNGLGGLYVTRPSLAHYLASPEERSLRCRELFRAIEGGLSVEIGNVYPLERADQAHEDLESRKTTGKSLLKLR